MIYQRNHVERYGSTMENYEFQQYDNRAFVKVLPQNEYRGDGRSVGELP